MDEKREEEEAKKQCTITHLIRPLREKRRDRIIHSVDDQQLEGPVAASEVKQASFLFTRRKKHDIVTL